MASKCPLCGEASLEKRTGVFHFEIPGDNPDGLEMAKDFPDSEWDECGACGEIILSNALQKRIGRWQYTRKGLLTPEEMKGVREKYGLTQAQMAHILQVGEKNFSRWENGITMQTRVMDSLIRQFDKCPEDFMRNEVGAQSVDIVGSYLRVIESSKGNNPLALAAHGGARGKKNKEALSRYITGKLEQVK
jgi:HTH-type transcriptional regulator / antitoxin MqsA